MYWPPYERTAPPTTLPVTVGRSVFALPRAWHLLSLDAPTVAATWCLAFSTRAPQAHATRWPVLFLALATWLCYVADRVLDARASASRLRARHHFYGALWSEQRAGLSGTVCVAAAACATVAWFGLAPALLRDYVLLTLLSLGYFAWVHRGKQQHSRVLAKEAAVGGIFAAGSVLPAWAASSHAARIQLIAPAVLFAAACWLNCVAIERWEGHGVVGAEAHWSTHWAARHLSTLLCLAALCAAALALVGGDPIAGVPLASCLAVAFVLLAVLEWQHSRLGPEALRILADAALLTPLAWWVVRGLFR